MKALLALVLGMAVLAGCSGDSKPTPTPGATEPPTDAAATSTPAPPQQAELPPIRQVYGARSVEITPGDPYVIKPGELWYFRHLCDACGGWGWDLSRAYRDGSGVVVIDDLKAKAEGLGTVVTFTANWRTGDAWLAACDGACSQYAGGSLPGISPRVYRSVDGGVTWKPEGHLPPSTRFLGLYDANEIVVETWDESNTAPHYWLYPSGKDLEFPQGLDPATTRPLVLNSGTTVWRTRAGTYHDASGGQLFGPLFAEMYPPILASTDIQYQHNYLTWTERPATPAGWDQAPFWSYVGHIDRDGQMTDLWGLAGDTIWITGEFPRSGDAPPALFGRFRFETSRDYVRDVSFGAVLTLADGRLHRLTELDPPPGSGLFTFVHDLVVTSNSERPEPNRWLRVTGAGKGDCLNVRESPAADARVITCVADDVLLAGAGMRQAAGGVEWVQVHTPGKMAGWVSAEFVR